MQLYTFNETVNKNLMNKTYSDCFRKIWIQDWEIVEKILILDVEKIEAIFDLGS